MVANIILDRLPDSVDVGGQKYPIHSDFRTSILFETLMQSRLSEMEKLSQMLNLYYPTIPEDREAGIKAALWFYNGGKAVEKEEECKNRTSREFRNGRIAYSFEQDAPYIYAAFRSEYHMNLQRIKSRKLHWWEFLALFDSLGERHRIKQIMYWRTCSTSGMPRKEVQRINELKKKYELKDDVSCRAKITLAQRNQRMKDYVKRRLEEVSTYGKE